MGVVGFDGFAARLVEESEQKVEPAKQFDEPLMNERLGNQNQDAFGAACEMEAVKDKAGFDRFAEPHFVSEKNASTVVGFKWRPMPW